MKLYTMIIPLFMVFTFFFVQQTAMKASDHGTRKINKENLIEALHPITYKTQYND